MRGLGFAFLNHGGIRVEVLKHVWMSLRSSGLFAAIRIQQNLKLDKLPKPLPERLIFIAREPFFGLDRISGFCSHQDPTKPETR